MNKTHLDQVWILDKTLVDRTMIIIIILVIPYYFYFSAYKPIKLVVTNTVVYNCFICNIALGK